MFFQQAMRGAAVAEDFFDAGKFFEQRGNVVGLDVADAAVETAVARSRADESAPRCARRRARPAESRRAFPRFPKTRCAGTRNIRFSPATLRPAASRESARGRRASPPAGTSVFSSPWRSPRAPFFGAVRKKKKSPRGNVFALLPRGAFQSRRRCVISP